ncbi:MAG TPA: ergothioneine biosynthesis protein EgtB [Acidimicrobiales bacterium]|nr:ergothioneine biosynthesis protein EgtB [Acidimicrobiales bacterium]
MAKAGAQPHPSDLARRYAAVRGTTEALAAPLSPEDQTVQSMPDVSPTKWHRGHTSWFFETFLLQPELDGYDVFHPAFAYIFNSYYETVGARHPRPERGFISRPGVAEVADYRAHVDEAMDRLMAGPLGNEPAALVELGIHHEQQHQELLLMDIKHVLSRNPLQPAYAATPTVRAEEPGKPGWIEHPGGVVEVGHDGRGFGFDNEFPHHRVLLTPFCLADRPVTCGEWLAFMDDGGYQRPELWLSDGWAMVNNQGWEAPLYWFRDDPLAWPGGHGTGGPEQWQVFTLSGRHEMDPAEPVCHLSYYEADAFAHWVGARLPTESEWEVLATVVPPAGNLLDPGVLHPRASTDAAFYGDVWEWTSSSYCPYPGFRTAPGAVGEYNGKFMVNQYVLRGGCCVTPADHVRATYRNFFPASARWAFSGVRLARDL